MTSTPSSFGHRLTHLPPAERTYYGLIAAWVLSMVSLPILRWLYGDGVLSAAVLFALSMQVLAVCSVLVRAWGWRRTAQTALVVAAIAYAAELIGSQTGFPFGAYRYTDRLQPQLEGVPLAVPLAWLMMMPPTWALAAAISARWPLGGLTRRLDFVAAAALAFTAWDLFLDPQMVAWDFWRWAAPGAFSYFGIPWQNYGGWLLVSALITWVARPAPLPFAPLALIYGITWALQSIGLAVFWNLPGPALCGFIGMGAALLIALVARRRSA
jgi:putative membrane protein